MPAKILVVDDDPSQRELLHELLEFEGYSVHCAFDGRHAEDALESCSPDLVLLDVNLPYKNGFELCRRIRIDLDLRLIPVVMVTGLTETEDRLRGIDAGADDFLTKPIDRSELKARVRSLLRRKEYTDELDRADQVLMALGCSIEAKDPYTKGHCARISEYSVLLGRALRLSADDLRALRIAGSVHDIGKIAVPDAILLKKVPLQPEEWAVMRNHTLIGEQICRPLRSFQPVLPIIRSHHEKQDGSGYPDGLCGEQVPLLARVMQLTDIFDALTTERSYKRALSTSAALVQMQTEVEQGWWDPALFRIFADLVRKGQLDYMIPILDGAA